MLELSRLVEEARKLVELAEPELGSPERPKYGDIRDHWPLKFDHAYRKWGFDLEHIFGHPSVNAPFGIAASDLRKFGTVLEVGVHKLIPAQPTVLIDGLEYKLAHPSKDPALVIRYTDGRLFLQNHTRVVAEIVRGHRIVRVLVMQYTGAPKKPYYAKVDPKLL